MALAVDLVRMADRDEFDVAYLLAADGDYPPAVEAVMASGKKVFAAAVSLDDLAAAFDRDRDYPRLVLLLSPT